MSTRSRVYVFTHNKATPNVDHDRLCQEHDPNIVYFGKGDEVGSNGNRHWQGMICLANAMTISAIVKRYPWLQGAHFEQKRGTFAQARNYYAHPCKKQEECTGEMCDVDCLLTICAINPVEVGVLPMDQAEKGRSQKRNWDEIREISKRGKFDELPAHVEFLHFKDAQAMFLRAKAAQVPHELPEPPKCYWLWGPPGSGKSRFARDALKDLVGDDFYLKDPNNKWWDDYKFQSAVLFEDIDESAKGLLQKYKVWLDRYAFPSEIKGSNIERMRPTVIYITSNYAPFDVFGPGWEPLNRRMEIIHFNMPL